MASPGRDLDLVISKLEDNENVSEEEFLELSRLVTENAVSKEGLHKLSKLRGNFKNEYLASLATRQKGQKEVVFSENKFDFLRVFMEPYTIGTWSDYKEFIEKLRHVLAEHRCKKMCLKKPVLPKQQNGKQPDRWIHIYIKQKTDNEGDVEESTMLVIRDDNLYVKGFSGRGGRWFELCENEKEKEEEKLPKEYYNATELNGWGFSYKGIMRLNSVDEADKTLFESARLCKSFAESAVRMLSRYDPSADEDSKDDENVVRLGLAGLIVIICEAARMDAFLNHFACEDVWLRKREHKTELATFMHNWKNMSVALLQHEKDTNRKWDRRSSVDSANNALDCVYLVLKSKKFDAKAGFKVEILDVSANFDVTGIDITSDKKVPRRKIYSGVLNQEKQRKKELEPLKLNIFECQGISGFVSFDIEVTLRNPSISVKRTWDCHILNKDATDSTELVTRTISLLDDDNNPAIRDKMSVTYLVMSNAVAVKTTVLVKIKGDNTFSGISERAKEEGGCFPQENNDKWARGTITAHIGGFEKHYIHLFRVDAGEDPEPFTYLEDKNSWILKLQRSNVRVPYGKPLQIGIKGLRLTPKSNEEGSEESSHGNTDGTLIFPFGKSSPATAPTADVKNGSKIAVEVVWEAERKRIKPKPEGGAVNFTINDGTIHIVIPGKEKSTKNDGNITTVVEDLRLAVQSGRLEKEPAYVLDGCKEDTEFSGYANKKGNLLVLQHMKDDKLKWIYIELQVEEQGEETSSTTLAVWHANCQVYGFKNKIGVWYDLASWTTKRRLPEEYNSVHLDWRGGVTFDQILGISKCSADEAMEKVNALGLGKDFAMDAVRTLSRYPYVEEGVKPSPREALAGLLIMFCESARFNCLLKHFEDSWKNGAKAKFDKYTDIYCIWNWGPISRTLLQWKAANYKSDRSEIDKKLKEMGIDGLEGALRDLHFVARDP